MVDIFPAGRAKDSGKDGFGPEESSEEHSDGMDPTEGGCEDEGDSGECEDD
jgi:hypothetical protein